MRCRPGILDIKQVLRILYLAESLGRSAGARFTVMRLFDGNSSPALAMAERTRSRAGVGQADQREAGQAVGEVDLDTDRAGLQAEQRPAVHQ